MNSLSDLLWLLVRWAIPITFAGVVAAIAVGTSRINEEICAHVENVLAERFPNLEVDVQQARIDPGKEIVIHGLSLIDKTMPVNWQQILRVDEVHLACDATLATLALGQPEIDSVRVVRPTVHAVHFKDGSWNVEKLLGNSTSNVTIPVSVEAATILYEDAETSFQETFQQGRLELEPATDNQGTTWSTLRFTLSGQTVEQLTVTGAVSLSAKRFELEASLRGLDFQPQLFVLFPEQLTENRWWSESVDSLSMQLSFSLSASGSMDNLADTIFEVRGNVSDGRFAHKQLPFPLADISADFIASQTGFEVQSIVARSGGSQFQGSLKVEGWSEQSDYEGLLEAEQLIVGRQWQPFIPPDLQGHWQKLLPEGEVDLRAEVQRKNGCTIPKVSLRCRNVSLTHYRFPYRLDRTVGTVILNNKQLTMHLTGQAGGNPVQVNGQMQLTDAGSIGHIEVRGREMPLDERLLTAMPARGAEILERLHASGTFDFVFRQDRSPEFPKGHFNSLDIKLLDCTLKDVRFPYPLTSVQGSVFMSGDNWTLTGITGRNDTGIIKCSGHLDRRSGERGVLTLELAGSEVVLDQELRDALPVGIRGFWDDLAPRGKADFVATVKHIVGQQKTEVVLDATPHANTVSIEPVWFPYRLEQLQGKLTWNNGLLQLGGWRGVHARTTVSTEGNCRFLPDGSWHVSLSHLSADRFRADHELLRALPDGMQEALSTVGPNGLLSIDGSLDIYSTNVEQEKSEKRRCAASWNCHLDVEQGCFDVGVALNNVHGGLSLRGSTDGQRWSANGEIDLDSAIWQGVQLTQVRGPILMDQSGVRFGAMTVSDGMTPRRLTAKIAGGKIEVDGMASSSGLGGFTVAASLVDADLERIACDSRGTPHRFKGRVFGSVEISGTRAGTHSLRGHGQLRLRDADVYELPLVVAMLKMLRVKAPDRSAFGSSFIQFRIAGPHAYLDEIELSGDAISLVGNGEVGFDGDVQMIFRSIMGDAEEQLPAMKRMLGGASGQFLLLHVDGSLDSPELSTEAFPTLAAAIQKLQSQRLEKSKSRRTASRPLQPGIKSQGGL